MKTNFLKSYLLYALLAFGMAFSFTACSDDDDDTKDEIVLDGIYIKGAATSLTELKSAGMMKVTRNEVLQTDRASLVELYVAVKAGDEGFNIVSVAGNVTKTWGPGEGFAEIATASRHNDEPKDGSLQKGAIAETATKFTVPEDGLYHVVIDTELGKGAIARVTWGVIGAATPGGWGTSTALPAKAFNLNKMEFEATNLKMEKGDFKYRYSNGWKIFLDEVLDLGGGKKGVSVNTNFGGNPLIAGGDNIANANRGFYTVNFTWELGKAPAVTLTKTGDIQMIDYSTYSMGIIGNCYEKSAGVQEDWGANYPGKTITPTKAGNVYTWAFTNVAFTVPATPAEGFKGQFKFRQGTDWNGKSIGYKDVTLNGGAAGDIETNGDGNFVFKANTYAGTYDVTLVINAETEIYTVTVTKK
jgi:hypothetical protein